MLIMLILLILLMADPRPKVRPLPPTLTDAHNAHHAYHAHHTALRHHQAPAPIRPGSVADRCVGPHAATSSSRPLSPTPIPSLSIPFYKF